MAEVSIAKQEQRDPITRWLDAEMPLVRGSLFGVNPFALMRHAEDMDRTFGSSGARAVAGNGAAWCPAVEVKEKDGKLLVTAELPGLKKEDVKVTVTEGTLVLEGERKQEKEEKREGYYHSERSYGKFYRSIPLPDGAKIDQTAAQVNSGVLEITVPLAEKKQKSLQIAVQEGKAQEGKTKMAAG